ncbi:hypothetical protein HYT02_02585 [Candidatus Gottesmanbacteria bacterium]|nr:hypothetical protein [Candidatus Gottesmanbacteria bacterium]
MVQNSNSSPSSVTVSVPGKINLMGEHAIVHGKPALISAINWRLYATVKPSTNFSIKADSDLLINESVKIVCNKLKLTKKPKVIISVSSQIPIGRHAGSSAAVSVATLGALLYYLKKVWNPLLINELAYEVEKKKHGNPSGGDNTTVTFGGFIWYRKELEFLKSVWQLPFKPSKKLGSFILIDTGSPVEHTGEMIAIVSDFIKKNPDKAARLLDENERAVKDMTMALKTGDEPLLLQAIRNGQRTLEALGAVSLKVMPLIKDIEDAGWAVKICGGGGSKGPVGLMLCYTRDEKLIQKIAKKYKYIVHSIALGEEGVRLEVK